MARSIAASLIRPVAEPLYQARPAGDVVIDGSLKGKLARLQTALAN